MKKSRLTLGKFINNKSFQRAQGKMDILSPIVIPLVKLGPKLPKSIFSSRGLYPHNKIYTLHPDFRQCPQARMGNPTFPLSDFCFSVVTCYILLSTAPRLQARFWFFDFRTPEIRVWDLAGYSSNGRTNDFLLSFSFLGFFFLLHY